MSKVNSDAVLARISTIKGNKRITGKELSETFDIPGAMLRECINKARKAGHPICSDSKGYSYGRSYKECLHTYNQLNSRAKEIREAAEGMIFRFKSESGYVPGGLFDKGGQG